MKYYFKVLKEYSVFHGRATRKEYWYFALFNILFLMLSIVLDNLVGTNFKYDHNGILTESHYGWIYSMYSCALFVPALSILVRRLHDVSKSGWMFLIVFIPLVGVFWLLVLLCLKSKHYDNEWGADPYPDPIVEEEVVETALEEPTSTVAEVEALEGGEDLIIAE